MEQAAENKRGRREMEWTSDDRRQEINNQPLMGVAKAGGDTAVNAKAALAVNGAFCRRWTFAAAEKLAETAW